MRQIFAALSTILAIVSGPSYLSDILKGRAKPQRTTFFIFFMLSVIAFYGQWKLGATLSLIFTGLDVIGSLVVFLLALKFGTSGFSRKDQYALVVALIGLGVSVIAKAPVIAIIGAILADLAAMALTLHKTYLEPHTEPYISWFLFGSAAVFSALSSQHYTFGLLLYPVYIALATFAIPLSKYIGTRRLARELEI